MKTAANITTLVLALLAAACAGSPNPGPPDLPGKVAAAYGLKGFDQVEQIRYTFNVKLGEKQFKRGWTWWPETDRVEYRPADDAGQAATYNRKDLGTAPGEELKKADAAFINDQYWLLFPFHLAWDRQADIKDTGRRPLPIGKGEARSLVVSYPPTGGYTPGDVYELFVDENYRLVAWIYRKGGASEPTRVSSWEDHRRVGPLTLSLDHRGPDGNFRVWFSEVAVKLKGSESWLGAE
jgi:hypothetical protein